MIKFNNELLVSVRLKVTLKLTIMWVITGILWGSGMWLKLITCVRSMAFIKQRKAVLKLRLVEWMQSDFCWYLRYLVSYCKMYSMFMHFQPSIFIRSLLCYFAYSLFEPEMNYCPGGCRQCPVISDSQGSSGASDHKAQWGPNSLDNLLQMQASNEQTALHHVCMTK